MHDCEGSMHPRARAGIVLFNQGHYFEAHEELELAWRKESGRIRQLYQGILEASVTYLHIRRHNFAGALKVYGRSMRWLRSWPDICRGACIGQLRRDMEAIIAETKRLGPSRMAEIEPKFFKPILWEEG